MLVYAVNGRQLSVEQGFPLRLIHRHKAGYKLPKWIQHIIISGSPVEGFWEQHGWDTTGTLAPIADTHIRLIESAVNETVQLSGIAHGGKADVRRVEVRIDGGAWHSASFIGGDTGTLAHWQAEWQSPVPGIYRVQIRAVAADGHVQPEATQTFVTVKVRA